MTDDLVELSVPADGAFASVVRTVTAALAARCDLTIDQIEDLRIAVDEACALLLHIPEHGPALSVHLGLHAGRIDVEVSIAAPNGGAPDRDGFGWTVLTALADTVDLVALEGRQSIRVAMHRPDASP